MDYKLKSVPFRTRATPNITPFTYYDGATYLEILERLRKWLTDVLTPAFDDVVEIIDGMIQEALEGVERDLDEMRDEVQDALDSVAETDAELRAYVDDVLQQVINNSIELQDPVMAGIVNDGSSLSRQAILDATNPNTILIESGDDDTFAWQSAVDRVIADRASGAIDADTVITIKGISPSYALSGAIEIRGLTNVVFRGSDTGYAKFSAKEGGGSFVVFRAPEGTGQAETSGIVFEKFNIDGGLVTVAPDGVFDRRQDNTWGDDRISAFVSLGGSLVPGETSGVIKDISVIDNRIYGCYSLPIHFRGVESIRMSGNTIRRSLDTGFVHCRNIIFTDNNVQWSSDNGVSLSRGCEQGVISNNTIEGSYYAGIHIGGFNQDAGPRNVTVSGNTVLNSRQYGISAIDGTSESTIVGNVVDGVKRGAPSGDRDSMGDTTPAAYGTGIVVGGRMTGESTGSATVHDWAEDITISANVVKHADRCGIMLKGGVRRTNIVGNIVTDIGSLFSVSGTTEISPGHISYNIGIGILGDSISFISAIGVTGNQVIDTRSTPIIGRSYFFNTSCVMASNYDYGARRPNSRALVLRGSGAVDREIEFGVGAEDTDFVINQDQNRRLNFYGFVNDATALAMRITRAGAVSLPSLRTITGVTSNLYVDAQGEVRKIT